MLKIAITGSTGLIGSRIIELLNKDFKFIPLLEENLDITNKEKVCNTLTDLNFDILFHLAAYTNVDGAEKNKERCYKINVEGAKNVFETVNNLKKKFIYVSTDFVFAGNFPPYYEDNKPNPISYYALTKFEAEKIVNKKAMIVRFAYPYRALFEQKKDFVRNIKNALENKQKLQMVTDSLITPTFIDDIAYAMRYLFNNFSSDIFHIVGADSLSPFNAGKLIAETFNLDSSFIQPVSYKEYFKNRAKRPKYSEIKTKKNNFYKMKGFENGLKEIKQQLTN